MKSLNGRVKRLEETVRIDKPPIRRIEYFTETAAGTYIMDATCREMTEEEFRAGHDPNSAGIQSIVAKVPDARRGP